MTLRKDFAFSSIARCIKGGVAKKMVPKAGLEPARVAPLPPQDSVSTKFHHFGISKGFEKIKIIQQILPAPNFQVQN